MQQPLFVGNHFLNGGSQVLGEGINGPCFSIVILIAPLSICLLLVAFLTIHTGIVLFHYVAKQIFLLNLWGLYEKIILQQSNFLSVAGKFIGRFQYKGKVSQLWMVYDAYQCIKADAALTDACVPVFV